MTTTLFELYHLVSKRTLNHLAAESSNPVAVAYTSDIAPVSNKDFLDIQATIECRFTLKRVRHMAIADSQKKKIKFK